MHIIQHKNVYTAYRLRSKEAELALNLILSGNINQYSFCRHKFSDHASDMTTLSKLVKQCINLAQHRKLNIQYIHRMPLYDLKKYVTITDDISPLTFYNNQLASYNMIFIDFSHLKL